ERRHRSALQVAEGTLMLSVFALPGLACGLLGAGPRLILVVTALAAAAAATVLGVVGGLGQIYTVSPDQARLARAMAELATQARLPHPPKAAFGAVHEAHQAARYLARCIPFAEKDAGLPEAGRERFARSYGDCALALLRLAAQFGSDDLERMKGDADLAPLRQRDDFQQLLRELEAKKP